MAGNVDLARHVVGVASAEVAGATDVDGEPGTDPSDGTSSSMAAIDDGIGKRAPHL